jgi:hypothetical protein
MSFRKLIVVEGSNDQFVVQNLLTKHGIGCEVQRVNLPVRDEQKIVVQQQGNREKVLNSLDALLDTSELEQIGVIIDADDEVNLRDSWTKLKRTLQMRGIEMPDEPVTPFNSTATVSFRQIPIGIWIMPGESLRGELEDFFGSLISDEDALWTRARATVDAIPAGERLFKKDSKAFVHTWLAWQKEPGEPMGQAIKFGYVRHNSVAAVSFVKWVRDLFSV